MKTPLRFIAGILLLAASCALAQNARNDGVVFARSGFPAPGASIAVCSQVPITAATESVSTVTITSTLNPPQGSTVTIVGMTPTAYNGSYTVVTTSGTSFTYTNPTQGLGAGTVFGSAVVTSSTPCAPVAALCASYTDTVCTSPNPVTADGLGNYNFFTKPGHYTVQFYGSGLTARTQTDQVAACDPSSSCTMTGPITVTGAVTAAQGILNPTANNVDVLALTRFTDSGPTGNFLNFKSAALSTLFKVDILGNLTAVGGTFSGALNGNGTNTFANLNKVIYVDQQAGATADVKFSNACTALPAGGGTLDASGFGAGNQTIAATVSCGSQSQPVRFKFDPATVFQPSAASTNMFQVNYNNVFDGLLHIDTSNQTYTGNAIQLPSATSVSRAWVRAWVVMSAGATGPCFTFTSTGSNGVVFSDFDITCTNVGTAASAVLISSGGTSFFNGNHIKLTVNNTVSTAPKYCVNLLVTAAGGGIGGNDFNIHCEMNSAATALAGVHLNSAAAGNSLGSNRFQLDAYDIQGTNQSVIVDAGNICQNVFWGLLGNGTGTAVTENTTCGNGNEYHDLSFATIQRTGSSSSATYNGTVQIGVPASQVGVLRMYGGEFFVQQGNPAGVASQDTIYGDSTGIKENVNNSFGGSNAFGLMVFAPCFTLQKAETGADTNVLTCSIPGGSAGPGTYRAHIVISVSAANAATIGWTATWKDSNGNAQAPTNLSLYQEGTAAPALTFTTSAAGNYHGELVFDVDNSGVFPVIKTTFSGTSVAEKVSATVERIQ